MINGSVSAWDACSALHQLSSGVSTSHYVNSRQISPLLVQTYITLIKALAFLQPTSDLIQGQSWYMHVFCECAHTKRSSRWRLQTGT